MWVRGAAIRPVPSYARVSARVLARIEEKLAEDDLDPRAQLDDAFARFEQTQPALASRISNTLHGAHDETALALGYFLTLAIWLAFDELFGDELDEVTETALVGVEESLALDEDLRRKDPAEAVDSDDVIAMEQPDVLTFVQEHVEAAVEANKHEVNLDDVDAVYRVVLIEVLALSYAVRPPSNWVALTSEFTA